MTTTNEKRTTTTTTTGTSSTSTRAYARTREELAQDTVIMICMEELRRDFSEIFNRPMPRFTERELLADLEQGTPASYYSFALKETALAPMPAWRYTLAIVARLKRQQVPPEDLLWF